MGSAGEGGAIDSASSTVGSVCQVDADCAGVARGFCQFVSPGYSVCASSCVADDDCASGSLCLCDGTPHGGTCVAAGCTTDADCGEGRCAQKLAAVCGEFSFACQKAEDHCEDFCASCVDGFQVKACGQCGRPFLIADEARVAAVASNRDWLAIDVQMPSSTDLEPSLRSVLAAHWARLGQMEHASIAAFARFNLQLLSLGAPAALVERCTQALADETKHTKLCFAFASHYAGAPLGPARLDISQSLNDTGWVEIMTLVLNEGCLGETRAALEAAESAEAALDPALERAYALIAADEQRHAELAFQFLRWALGELTPEDRAQFASAATALVHESAHSGAQTLPRISARDRELGRHGVLDSRTIGALGRVSALEIVAPLLDTLLRSAGELPSPRPSRVETRANQA